ncbi:ankyrin repeat protein [Hypoxylon trugodes]|uniref:ankyrin repeat protein n=1 Tax=Hypoxylon trugodes TaxID=326681 RepID=UPI0021917771|nr:ankyrin repeat protein [Hypoxylon trugodes]KAI1387300.1 ankyrin repeat protein [Hypoxylon trugodes]
MSEDASESNEASAPGQASESPKGDASFLEKDVKTQDDGDAKNDENDDARSTGTRTTELLTLPNVLPQPTPEILNNRKLGLDINKPMGWNGSDYIDYDIITVHGIRDDYKKVWINDEGKWWVRDHLFKDLSNRQVDYSYLISENSTIYEPNGILSHAEALVTEYARRREALEETETDRPIIWICHDIGGSIVKEALSLAVAHPEKYGKIAILTTAIIFLGCPHRAHSIDDLEDQIYQLIQLPGPDIKYRVTQKVKDLARQVNAANETFLATKLLDRAVVFNVFTHNVRTSLDKCPIDDNASYIAKPSGPYDELANPVTPFPRYAHAIGHSFEAYGRIACLTISHMELMEDDPSDGWLPLVTNAINIPGSIIKVNYHVIQFQARILSLLPPTRALKVDFDPATPRSPIVAWIRKHPAFKKFTKPPPGPRILHIHGSTDRALDIADISQRFWLDYDCAKTTSEYQRRPESSTIYFEFDQQDSRYSTLSTMLLYFINALIWRFWEGRENVIQGDLKFLDDTRSWSLNDLYHLFKIFMYPVAVNHITFFIGCFDQCPQKERNWFLERVLDVQSYKEKSCRMIISTANRDDLAVDSFPEDSRVDLADSPKPNQPALDSETRYLLRTDLDDLIERRPIFKHYRNEIQDLLDQCQGTPHLGYSILKWLDHGRRGISKSWIGCVLKDMAHVSPQNLMNAFLSSLSPEKKAWAKDVFHLVKYAAEPWSPEALVEALAVRESSEEFSLDDLDSSRLTEELDHIFGGMIVVDGRDVKFSHNSYRGLADIDVTGNPGDYTAKINGEIVETCLKYLGLEAVQEKLSSLFPEKYVEGTYATQLDETLMATQGLSMMEYAVRFWPTHYQLSGKFKLSRLVHEFFSNRKSRAAWEFYYYKLSNPFNRIQRSYISPLPIYAMLGLEDLVDEQISREKSLPSFKQNISYATTEAVRIGNEQLSQQLIKEVAMNDQELQEALLWTAARGDSGAVDSILEKIDPKTIQWSENILCRAAAAGLDKLLIAAQKSGCNIDETRDYLGTTPFGVAVWWDQLHTVKALLDSDVKPNLNIRDDEQSTPFLTAVNEGNPRMISLLLQDEAVIHHQTSTDRGVMQLASESGNHKAIELLYKANADIDSEDKLEPAEDAPRPPLIGAASFGYSQCARELLKSGAKPDVKFGSSTPMSEAILNNSIDTVRVLLEYKASIKQEDGSENMHLMRAIQTENFDLVSLLIEHGLEVNITEKNFSNVKTPLSLAANLGNIKLVELLLEKGADVNFCGGDTDSPLFSAFYRSETEVAKLLLEKGGDVNWSASDGWTPLHAAYDMPHLIPELLKRGVNIDSICSFGTITMMASRRDEPKTIAALLEHGDSKPDLEIVYGDDGTVPEDIGYTALLIGCRNKAPECVKLLLDAGADPTFRHSNGDGAVDICVQKGDSTEFEECLKHLLPYNPDLGHIDDQGDTLLHKIHENTLLSIVKLLVEEGAPTDVENNEGYTPLAVAINENNIEVAKYLIEQNVNVNVYSSKFGSILHLACSKGSLEMVKLLIEANADPSVVNPEYSQSLLYTALNIGNENDRLPMIRYLVDDVKVDINAMGGRYGYPLILAASECSDEGEIRTKTFKFLIRRKAYLDVSDDQGRRAVHLAATTYWDAGLKLLAEADADLTAKDKYGRTPLHFAAGCEYSDCINYLVTKDVDINVVDQDGWTPLMWAARSGTVTTIHLLLDKGADLWARGHSYDADWSALKLGNFVARYIDIEDLLAPKDLTRKRSDGEIEEWDEYFHKTRPASNKYKTCWSCLVNIWGIQWKCIECTDDVSLCFKCYSHRSTMHNPEHNFEEIGPLYLETSSPAHSQSATDSENAEEKAQSDEETPENNGGDAVEKEEDNDDDDGKDGEALEFDNETIGDDTEFNPDDFDVDAESTL